MIARRALAAVVAALGVAACGHHPDAQQLALVRRADLVIGVDVTGELEAVDSTDIKPPALASVWNFKIAMLAPEGSDAKPGQPVVAFDPSELVRDLENMKNEADAAQKKLDKKRDDAALARRDEALKIAEAEAALKKAKLKTTSPSDLVASVDEKTFELDVKAAQLALEQAKNRAAQAKRSDAAELENLARHLDYAKHRVEELEHNVARMTVTAPRAGTIVYPTDWRGEKKKVGDTAWRMSTVIQIVGLGKMIGKGQVDEVDIAKIAVHQPVSLRLDALPDVELHGTVQTIAKAVETKSESDPSKVVTVEIALDPTTTPLRPGMRFRGQIETEKLPGVVQVPADAVFVTAGGPVAYRMEGGKLEQVHLVLGRRNASAIEVKRGLTAGDRVSRVDPHGGGA